MKLLYTAAIVLTISLGVSGSFVSTVVQNYQKNINDLLVEQIHKELAASYIYHAYASYFQRADVSLPGVKKFFADASKEERDHAQMLIDYINSRGGHAEFHEIDIKAACESVREFAMQDTSGLDDFDERRMCICGFVATKTINDRCDYRHNWQEALMGFEDTLATERYVNNELLRIHKEAEAAGDAHLTHILEHHFLEEQVSSINQIAHFVTRLRSFARGDGQNYKLGEYIFDQNMPK